MFISFRPWTSAIEALCKCNLGYIGQGVSQRHYVEVTR